MTTLDIAHRRLSNQQISGTLFKKPSEIVGWLGAVQAQDYLGSLWALGLRTQHAVEEEVEQAIAAGTIVRSWPLRGTLHYVAAADIRWMLKLGAPRTIARAASRYRELELDEATFAKSNRVLARALQGGKQLTRLELAAALNRAGIPTDGQRLIHLLNRSALDGLTCYAARRGKQFTFALLEEWVAEARTLERDEALAELARRYFTSRGPATLQDFVWWSGLTTADARAGLEMAKPHLTKEIIKGQTYWVSSS
ncbi:MAG TPA: winged helix DNA-binding domain-containing protein, partial [Pyrinomonadaceae bacterium]